MKVLDRFRADLGRYFSELERPGLYARVRAICTTEAIWAIGLYRFGQYLREEAPAPVRLALRFPYAIAQRRLHRAVGIHLFPTTEIGPGLYIGHYGGIWVSPRAKLGARCNISHEVTIGVAGRERDAPRLGDRVWIGPSATISGPVSVGAGAVIAANSLIVGDVPENAVMIGVPARAISYGGSAHLIDLTPPPRGPKDRQGEPGS